MNLNSLAKAVNRLTRCQADNERTDKASASFPCNDFSKLKGIYLDLDNIRASDEHCKTFPAVQDPSSATSAAVWCPPCARRARQFLAGPLQRTRAMLNIRLLFVQGLLLPRLVRTTVHCGNPSTVLLHQSDPISIRGWDRGLFCCPFRHQCLGMLCMMIL